jgi:predicted metal-dependent hydrolase
VSAFIKYGEEVIHYEVHYLPSRKTLGIEVHPKQHVVVKAPVDCSLLVIVERLQKRAGWISRQLAEFERYNPRTPTRQYLSGETHLYLGRQYRLRVKRSETASVKLSRGELQVFTREPEDRNQVQMQLQSWYRQRAKSVFAQVMAQAMQNFRNFQVPRLNVRSMQSRWGSLSRAGKMTLNLDLIRAPRPCIECVVVHELCHLVHRDHDAKFFRLLTKLLPDWGKRKRRLELALL